ncbi:MAG: YceI family protein [Sideroxyarcus sp.]|nr:YceI family protein [Sideroxyarcus sp.]
MKTILFLMLALAGFTAQAADYSVLQPQQSSIAFLSRQMGVPMEGHFARFNAAVSVDPAQPEKGTARIDIETASIDVGSQEAYDEVIGKSWFDTAKFPQASFVSSQVTRIAPGRYEVAGRMTIRDVTREIRAPFTLEQKGNQLMVAGVLPIKRLEYGIGSGMWGDTDTIADEVQIRFRLTFAAGK